MSTDGRVVHVLYATATGTAEDVAQGLAETLTLRGASVISCKTIDEYEIASLPTHSSAGHFFIFVVATCGDGEVPLNMRKFWHFLRRTDLPEGILGELQFAIFGLGDRSYVKFNAAARKLHLRLCDLGASSVVKLSLGDESAHGGFDKELHPWIDRLCEVVAPNSGPNHADKKAVVIEPRISICLTECETPKENGHDGHGVNMWGKGQARVSWITGVGQLFEATVLRNDIVTDSAFLTDDKEVRHLELDVSSAPSGSGLLDYVPGDIIHVMPRNRQSAVDAFFRLTGFDGESLLDLVRSGSKTRFGSYPLNIKLPCNLREFVSAQLDLSCTPRRRFFERLAPFAADSMQKDKLSELASVDGADMLTQYAYREKRTILMVLRDFPSARPPLDHLIDMIPVLKTRAFSIASSKEAYPGEIHICASIVQYTTPLRFVRIGVCSAFFLQLKVGDLVPIFLEKGTSLRFNESKPCIMLGPGTGVAPMRSFISSCKRRGSTKILFFGCRSQRGDFLYESDWEVYLESDKLSSLVTAFSRETDGVKVYVQDKLREESERVWTLMSSENAQVYVAGAAGSMPKGIRQAIVDICAKAGGLSEGDSETFVRRMEAEGRLQMECW